MFNTQTFHIFFIFENSNNLPSITSLEREPVVYSPQVASMIRYDHTRVNQNNHCQQCYKYMFNTQTFHIFFIFENSLDKYKKGTQQDICFHQLLLWNVNQSSIRRKWLQWSVTIILGLIRIQDVFNTQTFHIFFIFENSLDKYKKGTQQDIWYVPFNDYLKNEKGGKWWQWRNQYGIWS